jgi:hypothetical protein
MQYTNRHNFPQYIADWLIADDYDYTTEPNTFSATTLLKPVKVYWLTERNGESLSVDVSDLAASKIGSAVHDSIERIKTPGVTKEVRLEKTIEVDGATYTVRGKFDILERNKDNTATLRDIKTTSVWSYILGGKDEDYCQQLSIYRWLAHKESFYSINDIAYVDFFFTDWQSSKAKNDRTYPPRKIRPGYEVQLMSLEETESFIVKKIRQLAKYQNSIEDQLPMCDKKELWATEEKYAVTKHKATKATKLCNSHAEAEQYMKDKNIKGYIEHRPFKVKRCKYCSAFPFCKQGKEYANSGRIHY